MPVLIQKFTFNPFQENTFVIYDEQSCIIVDPGCYHREEQEALTSFIEEKNLSVKAVLLTHAHIDHVMGLDFVRGQYDVDCYLHEEDLFTLGMVERSANIYGIPGVSTPAEPNILLKGGETIDFGFIQFEVLFTPGHCVGHVVYYNKAQEFVINGDVLFAGSYGRYDLPGGDPAVLKNSITEVMFKLPENTIVLSGHGPETTIGNEKLTNPILNL